MYNFLSSNQSYSRRSIRDVGADGGEKWWCRILHRAKWRSMRLNLDDRASEIH